MALGYILDQRLELTSGKEFQARSSSQNWDGMKTSLCSEDDFNSETQNLTGTAGRTFSRFRLKLKGSQYPILLQSTYLQSRGKIRFFFVKAAARGHLKAARSATMLRLRRHYEEGGAAQNGTR
ncbi:hypothetical protein AXG93_411s1220 [Marchantia polymorpha subsp. ruderalis]|uniref:Uncharacterized protein n=1 Tax=Marchantia polymorpha subsp. ruderalis TaxID=1480154 RepID=A0A176VIV1_MARPO|nr:hypothetical protein AXG93_411s1220 [Marchantia polymorpha subsp. ruderalis]